MIAFGTFFWIQQMMYNSVPSSLKQRIIFCSHSRSDCQHLLASWSRILLMAATQCKLFLPKMDWKFGLLTKFSYAANFTDNAYHGTVVWSWQLAMMGAGLERQLSRCETSSPAPTFCSDTTLHPKILAAYNHLWDVIDANKEELGSEVWSWVYQNGSYHVTPLGSLPPPPGSNPTESDIRQLWSLTFLAVTRNKDLK